MRGALRSRDAVTHTTGRLVVVLGPTLVSCRNSATIRTMTRTPTDTPHWLDGRLSCSILVMSHEFGGAQAGAGAGLVHLYAQHAGQRSPPRFWRDAFEDRHTRGGTEHLALRRPPWGAWGQEGGKGLGGQPEEGLELGQGLDGSRIPRMKVDRWLVQVLLGPAPPSGSEVPIQLREPGDAVASRSH